MRFDNLFQRHPSNTTPTSKTCRAIGRDRPGGRKRRLLCQQMEARQLMAADPGFALQLSGPGDSRVHDLEIDNAGDVFISGRADGLTDLDPGPDTANVGTNSGIDQAFVAKYTSEGDLLWHKSFDVGGRLGLSDAAQSDFLIELDSQQNVVLAGEFFVPTLVIDGQQANLEGEGNLFIARLSGASSQALWVESIGGNSGNLYAEALEVDGNDRIHVGGMFNGTIDFNPMSATATRTSMASLDGFVSSLDSDGNLLAVQTIASSHQDRIWSISSDGLGNLVYGGYFRGTATLTDGSGATTSMGSGADYGAFIAKSSNGTAEWVTEVAGSGDNLFPDVIATDDGGMYVSIEFEEELSVANDSSVYTSVGSRDLLVGEIGADGNFEWKSQIGGAGREQASGFAIGNDNEFLLSGNFSNGAVFGEGAESVSLESANSSGGSFLARFDESGSFVDASVFASAYGNRSIAVDSSGNTWVAGGFNAEASFFSGETMVSTGIDGFLSRINAGYVPPVPELLFEDSFETGSNSNDWNSKWGEDSQNDWFRSTQRASDGARSAEVDGYANNATLTMSSGVDATGFDSVELSFDWLIESGFDSGEYLAVDVWNGSSWIELDRLRGNVDAENTWHSESVTLDASLANDDLKVRFRSRVSRSNEDANVDNVKLIGTNTTPPAPNELPLADAGTGYSSTEGGSIFLSAAGSTDSDGTIVDYAWDLDGDGQFDDAFGVTTALTTPDSGSIQVALQVTDDQGGMDVADSTVTVINVAPVAVLSGPHEVEVGQNVALDASDSYDPGNDIVSYLWDLDADGQYDDASGPMATFSSTVTGIHTVAVQVTDADGAGNTAFLNLNVDESAPEPIDDSALVAHWTFDGTTADVAPSGASADDGTLRGDAVIVEDAIRGEALSLDGTGDYLDVADSVDLNTSIISQRTIGLWFNTDDAETRQVLFEEGGGSRGLSIYVDGGQVYVGGWNKPGGESGWGGTFLSAPIVAGQWHHVVLTLDGGTATTDDAMRGYLDGQLFGSGAGSQLWKHSGDVGIGAMDDATVFHDGNRGGDGFGLSGKIDEFRIYDRVLGANEVDQLWSLT